MVQVNIALLQEKADTIVRCLDRIKSKCPASLDALAKDLDAQDIIILNLERCIQAAVDIASHVIAYTPLPAAATMAESFVCLERSRLISGETAIRMVKATGLRNLLVHEYQKLDWSILWQVLQRHLLDPLDFAKEVMNSLSKLDPGS